MSEDIEAVVNAVADRIGVAAERLAPVAETMVRETATRHWVWAGSVMFLSGLLLCCVVGHFRELRKLHRQYQAIDTADTAARVAGKKKHETACLSAFVACAIFGVFSIWAVSEVAAALSPTVTLMESLK